MSGDLTDRVADALFMAELPTDAGTDSYIGRPAAGHLAIIALQAARAQGWRIVKAGDLDWSACRRPDHSWRVHTNASVHMNGCVPVVAVGEEWTGG